MSDAPPPGWEDILRPGETILWQGRPGQDFRFTAKPMVVAMGIFVTGFALFWTSMAFWMTRSVGFPVSLFPFFGLVFIYVGIRAAGGGDLWDAYRRRRTWYTLTDQRAFIARRLFGRRTLEQHDVSRFGPVEYDYGPPPSVWFGTHPGKAGKIGFRDIDDAHEVRDLIRDLQRDKSA